jgi:hypothetical protein
MVRRVKETAPTGHLMMRKGLSGISQPCPPSYLTTYLSIITPLLAGDRGVTEGDRSLWQNMSHLVRVGTFSGSLACFQGFGGPLRGGTD